MSLQVLNELVRSDPSIAEIKQMSYEEQIDLFVASRNMQLLGQKVAGRILLIISNGPEGAKRMAEIRRRCALSFRDEELLLQIGRGKITPTIAASNSVAAEVAIKNRLPVKDQEAVAERGEKTTVAVSDGNGDFRLSKRSFDELNKEHSERAFCPTGIRSDEEILARARSDQRESCRVRAIGWGYVNGKICIAGKTALSPTQFVKALASLEMPEGVRQDIVDRLREAWKI
jgi:hypothetical protein